MYSDWDKWIISDLHIHSKYSRATSKSLDLINIGAWGAIKGIHIIGSGDIFHPMWSKEFLDLLKHDDNSGFYIYTSRAAKVVATRIRELVSNAEFPIPRIIPTVETSHIYKDLGRVRKVHLVTIFRTIEGAQKIATILKQREVNLSSDGRPIMGISSYDYLQILLDNLSDSQFLLIPAHIWTPWFSLFGSKSGYDTIQEAFKDLTPYVTTLETGLSSDPKMNRLVRDLDKYILSSNSDAHSPQKLGREANIHINIQNIDDLFSSLRGGDKLIGTLEFYPEEGKYHYDGHRECNVSFSPTETAALDAICPICKKPITIGVLNRVYQLSQNNITPSQILQKYKSIYNVPLIDIINSVYSRKAPTKSTWNIYFSLIEALGTELFILHQASLQNISTISPAIACGIEQLRKNTLFVKPGYDGVYGIVKVNIQNCQQNQTQLRLI